MQCAILRSSLIHSIRQTQSVRELVKRRFVKDTYLRKTAQPYSHSQSFATRSLRSGVRKSTFACLAMEKTVLVPVANGTEEMEAVIIIDVLRRAGSKVTVASVEDQLEVVCSRGVKLVADASIGDCASESFDLIALPGGMPGAKRLYECSTLVEMMKTQRDRDQLHGAICASPAVFLEPLGFLKDKKATAHPAFVDQLTDPSKAENPVVIDGKLVTSRGPGTAFSFALALVKELYGEEKMQSVASPMVLSHH